MTLSINADATSLADTKQWASYASFVDFISSADKRRFGDIFIPAAQYDAFLSDGNMRAAFRMHSDTHKIQTGCVGVLGTSLVYTDMFVATADQIAAPAGGVLFQRVTQGGPTVIEESTESTGS